MKNQVWPAGILASLLTLSMFEAFEVEMSAATVSGRILLRDKFTISVAYMTNEFTLTAPRTLSIDIINGGDFDLFDAPGKRIRRLVPSETSLRVRTSNTETLAFAGKDPFVINWYLQERPSDQDLVFSLEDISNPMSLLEQVKEPKSALSSVVSNALPSDVRQDLLAWSNIDYPSNKLISGLVWALNSIVDGGPLNTNLFDLGWLRPTTKARLKDAKKGRQLNRELLEDSFASDLWKWDARPLEYSTTLFVNRLRFSQPMRLCLINTKSFNAESVESVTEIRFAQSTQISVRCEELHLKPLMLMLQKSAGFTNDDFSNLRLNSLPLARPKAEMQFIAIRPKGNSIPLSLSREYLAPSHDLHFGSAAFVVNDVEVDNVHMVAVRPYLSGLTAVRISKPWYFPMFDSPVQKPIPLRLCFVDPDVAVYNLRVSCDLPEVIALREPRLSQLARDSVTKSNLTNLLPIQDERAFVLSQLSFPKVSVLDVATIEDLNSEVLKRAGLDTTLRKSEVSQRLSFSDRTINLAPQITIPKEWPLGSYAASLIVEAANAEKRELPIKIEVVDSLATMKQGGLAFLGTLFSGYFTWRFLDRRKKTVEKAEEERDACKRFLMKKHLCVEELQRRVKGLSPEQRNAWRDVGKIRTWFVQNGLQEALTRAAWMEFRQAAEVNDAKRLLDILERDILSG